MIGLSYLRRRAWRDERAAQLVEFAVALPLLVVFVVGIFDFSNAFTLKQKLTNIARDAARTAAADPSTDLAAPAAPLYLPASISDAVQLVQNYLSSPNNINNCGLTVNSPSSTTAAEWTFTAQTTPPPCTLVLIINRGYFFSSGTATQTANTNCTSSNAPPAGQTAVVATCVSIQYTYPWQFGNVVGLLGGTNVLPTTIVGTAVAVNEN